jgi:hypothetical protein
MDALPKQYFTKTFYTSRNNERGIISNYRMMNSLMYIGNVPKLSFRSFRMDDATGNRVDLMERVWAFDRHFE